MESTQVIEILLGLLSFIGAGFIAVVIYVYKMSMKSLDDNSKLIADSNEKNDKAIADLTSKLIDHEASMGKAGKAIHGDMLEIQKEFNKLQTSFSDSIIEVKQLTNLTQRNLASTRCKVRYRIRFKQ